MAEPITISLSATAARFHANMHRFSGVTAGLTTNAVRDTALQALAAARAGTPVDTGALRKAWRGPRREATYTYSFGNTQHYAPTLEYGLYTRVGPRTTQGGGATVGDYVIAPGIFSKQAPVGMLRKALAMAKPGLYQRILTAHQRTWGQ